MKTTFILSFFIHLLTLSLTWAGASDGLIEKYEAGLEKIDTQLRLDQAKVLGQYETRLKKLYEEFRLKQDLTSLIVVKAEMERVKADQLLAEANVLETVEALTTLQNLALKALRKVEASQAQRIVSISIQVIERLDSLKSDLTRSEKIDEAVSVNEKISGIKNSERYAAAQKLVLERDAERKLAEKVSRPENTKDPTKPVLLKKRAEKFPDNIAWYVKGEEPIHGDINRMKSRHTGKHSMALSSIMSGNLETVHLSKETLKGGSSYYSRNKYMNRYIPRIHLVGGNESYSDVLVVIEHYTRKGSSPARAHVESITVPALEARGRYVVDCYGYSTRKETSRSRYYGDRTYTLFGSMIGQANGGYVSSSYARKYGGLIVSVFDKDKNLLFQRCSENSLKTFASAKFDPSVLPTATNNRAGTRARAPSP